MIIAKGEEQHTKQSNKQGKLEPKKDFIMQSDILS